MKNMQCKICKNSYDNKIYKVKEMMFGFKDEFVYFQCSRCECLQIAEIPNDMSKYYPDNYYSFIQSPEGNINTIKRLLKNLRNEYAVLNKGLLGRVLYKLFPFEELRILSEADLTKDSNILDVGCGSGTILYELKETGFKHLLGIDPYLKGSIEYSNGLKILKTLIYELDGRYDLIMFNHSFEHIPDFVETLQTVTKLLTKDGICLIRIPTVSSYAWQYYRENWVQLDAPRHFFLHSQKSISLLAERVGLKVEKIVYDSNDFQFWGSEQYIRGIPLIDSRSYCVNPKNSIFSTKEILEFKRKAKELNLAGQGDSCSIFLRKKL